MSCSTSPRGYSILTPRSFSLKIPWRTTSFHPVPHSALQLESKYLHAHPAINRIIDMFRDEFLTYEGADSLFRNWRPESDVLYELLFGALVTVFVYQLTKLILEISLGQKRRGEMLAYDLYIYMIVSGLSLSSVISSFRFKERNYEEEIDEDESPYSCGKSGQGVWVLGKYLVLLMLVPSIHIIGIFLGMEKERDLSFGDLKFGGLAMGLRESTSVIRTKSPFNGCHQVQTQLGQGETEMTSFFRCDSGTGVFIPFDNQDNIESGNFIAILRSSTTNIGVTVVTPGKRWISFLHLDIHDGKQPYFLRNVLTPEQRSQIFESGVRRMVEQCESPVQTRDIDISWVIPPTPENEPVQNIESALVECAGFDENKLLEIAEDMITNVTFVESEIFDVSRSLGNEFISGDDIIFVQRRGSSVSLLVMVLIILVVVVARIVVQFVLSNEGSFALDVILKDEFGLNCCDSMLQYEQPLNNGRQRQEEKVVKATSSSLNSSRSSGDESLSWASGPHTNA